MSAVQAPEVEGALVRLRGFRMADFDAYADFYGSDRARHVGGPMDRRKAWYEFASDTAGWQLRGYGMWAMELRDGGDLAGWAGIIEPAHYDEPELGWMVRDGYEGRGLAYDAAITARRHAHSSLGLDRLASFIEVGNDRSIRLAERLGAVLDRDAKAPDPEDLVYRHNAPEDR